MTLIFDLISKSTTKQAKKKQEPKNGLYGSPGFSRQKHITSKSYFNKLYVNKADIAIHTFLLFIATKALLDF